MFIKWIIGLIRALNSNQKPSEISGGIAFAFLLAAIPSGNLLWFALFFITFLLRVHLGIEMIFLAIFKLFIWVLDPVFHNIGYMVLTQPALKELLTSLLNVPLIAFTKINNTIVMGGLVIGTILWVPLFILFNILVKLYRNKLLTALENSKFVKWFLNLPVISTIAGALKTGGNIASALHK